MWNYIELTERDFNKISSLIYEKSGINLHNGKKELVRARLIKRLRRKGFQDFNQYYHYLSKKDDGEELIQMIDAISTNHTFFFREENHFDFLLEELFPFYRDCLNKNRHQKGIRFWSAGCSSGEEAYTIAICLYEFFGNEMIDQFKIYATDISTKVLAIAKDGIYHRSHIERVPIQLLRKYFQKGEGKWNGYFRVKPILKRIIEFHRLNLVDPFPFNELFHVIFCRNVMIYFDKKTRELLVNKFYDSMIDGGFLLIGHSESLAGIQHRFRYIHPTIYQK